MKRKRERLEVIHDILGCVQQKRKLGPTRLLQLSNLSPQMFKDYLGELLQSGLLQETTTKGRKEYSLTDKGHIFLDRYQVFTRFVEQLGL